MGDVGLVGLAIVLTLLAGLALEKLEQQALLRGWRLSRMRRPGGVALLIGTSLVALVSGLLTSHNVFLLIAAAVAAISGTPALRRGGRLTSFSLLWLGGVVVAASLDAELAAFGLRAADALLTGFLLAAFCCLLREWDAAGPQGWLAALGTSFATALLTYGVGADRDARLSLLIAGATFGLIAVAPFGAGLLGRVGSRFLGLIIGAMAVRAAVGTPLAAAVVALAGLIAFVLYALALDRYARGRLLIGAGVVCAGFAVLSAPAALELMKLYKPLRTTVDHSRALVRTNPEGGTRAASAQLVPIANQLSSYARRLEATPVQLGRLVPFVGANVRAATVSAKSASELAASARLLLDRVNVGAIGVKKGVVARESFDELTNRLRGIQFVTRRSQQDIDAGGSLDLLVPQLREGVDELATQLHAVESRVSNTLDGLAVAEQFLGYDRPHRFFIAVQNNAESRATGGYMANYGIVTMENGRVASRDFGRTSDFDLPTAPPRRLNAGRDFLRRYSQFDVDRNWPNINLSPDFVTTAKVVADQYRQSSGTKVDGVISIDPIGLAGLLRLTGPVRVASWPVPLTAQNIVNITLHDEYRAFENNNAARVDFLGDVAEVVFDRLVASGLDDVLAAAPVIDELTSTRRLQMWAPDKVSAAFLRHTGSDGAVLPTNGDTLMVTTQNAAGNKLDWFLRRTISYNATVQRDGDGIAVGATATIRLTNGAPATGEPKYVIGPAGPKFKAGQNRIFFTFYSPLDLTGSTIDGQPLHLDFSPELGRYAYSAFIDIPSTATRTIELQLSGRLSNVKQYSLDVFQQPTITPDTVDIAVTGAGKGGAFKATSPLLRDAHLELALRK